MFAKTIFANILLNNDEIDALSVLLDWRVKDSEHTDFWYEKVQ